MTHSADRSPASRRPMRPAQTLALGFLTLILAGGLLLSAPLSASSGRSLGLLQGMFTATSAVCVTGLSIIDPGLELSLFGQAVLLGLIQIGGLGFMVFATLAMVLLGRRVSLRNRIVISEAMNQDGPSGMVKLTLYLFALSLLVELAGAAVLATRFVPVYGMAQGLWYGFFHSVSAFCNAGFDLFGHGTSVTIFQRDGVVLLTLTALIVLGGLGFAVILELLHRRGQNARLSLHAKLVLCVTAGLLILGAAAVFFLEGGNPHTLGAEGLNLWDRAVNSLFQSATCRTAGFASIDQAQMNDTTKLLSCMLMFVGASPASTGGGVKTTTFVTVLLMVWSVVKGRERITVFNKEIAAETARRAISIVIIALGFILVFTCAISVLERNAGIPMLDLAFETTSAVTTTGLSSIGTGALRPASQLLLMPLMYLGRVGPLTLAVALANRLNSGVQNRIHHPEEKIMIG